MQFYCDCGLKLPSETQGRDSLWLKKGVKAIAEKEIFLLSLQQKPRIKKSVQRMVQGVVFVD